MTDLHRLVQEVAEKLGPTATADRVESLSRMVLDEMLVRDRLPMNAEGEADRAIVTITGASGREVVDAIETVAEDMTFRVVSITERTSANGSVLLIALSVRTSVANLTLLQQRLDAVAASFGGRVGVLHADLYRVLNDPHPIR